MIKHSLSSMEKSFWYQYRFDPTSDANNIIHCLRLTRQLDNEILFEAFNALVTKHEALRSNFDEIRGVQFRVTNQNTKFELVDASKLSKATILRRLKKPFKLEKENLLRAMYINENSQTTLYIASPHIIFDAQSWDIFVDDLSNALKQKTIGPPQGLEYAPIDKEAQDYWQAKLNSIEGRVSFQQTHTSQKNDRKLGQLVRKDFNGTIKQLIDFANLNNISTNALCISLLAVVLYKITGDEQILVASPANIRNEKQTRTIGSFINVLPILAKIDSNLSFIEFENEVTNTFWNDLENRNFSLIELMRDLKQKYSDDSQGISNVMVEFIKSNSHHNPLIAEDIAIENKHAKQDFILSVISEEQNDRILIEYDASKLESGYVRTISEVLFTIAHTVIEDPKIKIKNIAAVTNKNKKHLIKIGSGATKEVIKPFVWNRFQEITHKHPRELAVIENGRSLTYEELLTMAEKYASQLVGSGIKKGSVVGINMERSSDYIAAMLAIWSLGAIYVPLDVSQPQTRLGYMVEKGKISAVVCNEATKFSCSTIIPNLNKTSVHKSNYEPHGEDIAYIIFTSGSTGEPKGVMIEHNGFLNHLEIMINELGLDKRDVVAQTAPVSFDISVWQLICPLMVGGAVRILSNSDVIDPEILYTAIKRDGITVLEVVPSLLSAYLSAEELNMGLAYGLNNVHVITTGEAIKSTVAKQWTDRYPYNPLLNAYGPAEASDDTHFFDISPYTIKDGIVPIGRPLLNIRTYIVDKDLQLCPKGVIGEICIGGISVSRGYVGNKEITRQSFVHDKFDENNNFRLYRTGDYGRWNNNLLEYHGRRDNQVKVRGQRLELGEIESKINEITGVKDVAVIAHESTTGTKLIGYVVPNSQQLTAAEIKSSLASSLPEYMIPWKCILVPELPKNANGKLDKKALSLLEHADSFSEASARINSHQLTKVIKVYSSVLNCHIDANSNYFDCGGDSLQSMRIVSQLQEENIAVGVRDILTYQTPRELIDRVNQRQIDKLASVNSWPKLKRPNPIQKHYLEVTGKGKIDNGEVQAAHIALDKNPKLDSKLLLDALNLLITSHAELKPSKNSHALVIEKNPKLSVEEQLNAIREQISLETPLIGCITNLSKAKEVLLVAHHYVVDFYSWDIIRNEINDIFATAKKPIFEDTLSRWWGKALQDLAQNDQKLNSRKEFWSSIAGSNLSEETHNTPISKTMSFTFAHSVDQAAITNLSKKGIVLENFIYYIIAKTCISLDKETSFTFNIESTLRSLQETSMLSKAVGWMSFVFPQTINNNDTLCEFNNSISERIKNAYEYGLLHYNIFPKYFANKIEPIWSINYLGKSLQKNPRIKIIKTLPVRDSFFVEVNVINEDSKLLFEIFYNTTTPKQYFVSFSKLLQELFVIEIQNALDSKDGIDLSPARKEMILERLRNVS